MNPAPLLIARLLRFDWPPVDAVAVRTVAVRHSNRRRAARLALGWCLTTTIGLHGIVLLALEAGGPRVRDPEYGRRTAALQQRLAENPGRPLVLVVGSSRASMGVRPAAWEAIRPNAPGRPDPLLFNLSLVGSGPMMELWCLQRAYADGFRPAAVVLEYWPPFLREDGPFYEPARIDPTRLAERDRDFVPAYFADSAAATERRMFAARRNPLYENRQRLLAQLAPRWQPWDKRIEMAWANLDGWGWLPGLDEPYPPDPALRRPRLAHCEAIYRGQFHGHIIHPLADRALGEAVALARANGTRVAFAYLPEASEFREWMPPEVERACRDHLALMCRDLKVPLIDARVWMPDGYLVDGFHLSREGAAAFTKRFAPAIAAAFPDLGEQP